MGHTEYAEAEIEWIPEEEWQKKIEERRGAGVRISEEMRRQSHTFQAKILAPRYAPKEKSVFKEFNAAVVVIERDWKIATKLEMVEDANNLITKAYMIDSLDAAFPLVLTSVIEGKGLYEHSIGEFFLLYGRLEQTYNPFKGKETREKMEKLLNGEKKFMKEYTEYGKTRPVPLPYAVRNILSHVGNNPNTLEVSELRTSIALLKSWVEGSSRVS